MQYDEKIRRLKGLTILKQIPDRQLTALAEFLRPRELKDGETVFEEGSTGMSLYFVSSGQMRITRRVAGDTFKDLAVLGPGEFFGEMALIEEATRSASAKAIGAGVIFELFRGDLSRWVKSNPQQAVQFFAELVHILSMRLRRTSNELTLHFDLSGLLLERGKPAPEFLGHALDRVLPHLDGPWSAAAYLRDASGAKVEMSASRGDFGFDAVAQWAHAKGGTTGGWTDGPTFYAPLVGRQGNLGVLVFHPQAAPAKEVQEEIGRTLTTVSRLVATALDLEQLAKA